MSVQMACSLLLLFSAGAFGQSKTPPQQTPPDTTQRLREARVFQKKPAGGYVPDATTAVRIAEAVLMPIYGAKQIGYEKPFDATLDGDVWTVNGTLHCKNNGTVHLRRWNSRGTTIENHGRGGALSSRRVNFKTSHYPGPEGLVRTWKLYWRLQPIAGA
jgi:hypothetical protein